eukprot:2649538-Prymnesium_polylepis.1
MSGRGPPNRPPPAPPQGVNGYLVLACGVLHAFDSLAGAFDSTPKRGTLRYGSDSPPKRVHVGKQRVAQM